MEPLVLNTRPATDAADLEVALLSRGYRSLSAPMLEIGFPEDDSRLDVSGYQGLIFTSANGIRAFIRRSDERTLPALCVGDATANLAFECGFKNVRSANGDIHALATLITETVDPTAGALFHPAASKPAGDLGHMLRSGGYDIDRKTVYEAHGTDTLPDDVLTAITGHHVDAVLFFSPRTAETFGKLVAKHKLEGDLAHIRAICLSAAVQTRIGALTWQSTHVAPQPTQEYLLSTLDTALK